MYDYVVKELPEVLQSLAGLDVHKVGMSGLQSVEKSKLTSIACQYHCAQSKQALLLGMARALPSEIESSAVQLKLTNWFADLGISLWAQHGRPWSLDNLPEKC